MTCPNNTPYDGEIIDKRLSGDSLVLHMLKVKLRKQGNDKVLDLINEIEGKVRHENIKK